MYTSELHYTIAVSMLKHVGHFNGRKLIEAFGSAKAVFHESPQLITRLKISNRIKNQLRSKEIPDRAEKEISFMQRHGIHPVLWSDSDYPFRLRQCTDGPLVIYTKGDGPLNPEKSISIVGTRKATSYGKEFCRKLIKELSALKIQIVSGLALGIDTCAHQSAVEQGLPTVAVLAHGLNRLYPGQNRQLAIEIAKNGMLMTDFATSADFLPGNFPARNRIIAGLSDATVVIESDRQGGSIITAELANSYNRDVFALPGLANSANSAGCNNLIKQNKAALIESADDLIKMMNWSKPDKIRQPQKKLFIELSPGEHKVVNVLKEKGAIRLDEISMSTGQSLNDSASMLLDLEFRNIVRSLPGNIYALA